MGIQALMVFIGITIALTVGVFANTLDVGAPLLGWLVIGLVPATWASLRLIERAIGRQIWDYTAPYPYRWMEVAVVADASRPPTVEGELIGVDAEEFRQAA